MKINLSCSIYYPINRPWIWILIVALQRAHPRIAFYLSVNCIYFVKIAVAAVNMRCSEFRAVVLRHFIFLYHESSASLTFISHLEGYFSTGVVHTVSNHASLRNMARHNHSLRVSSWEFTLASTTQLVDGLCFRFFFFFSFFALHRLQNRVAFHEYAFYMLIAQWIMFLHARNSICGVS